MDRNATQLLALTLAVFGFGAGCSSSDSPLDTAPAGSPAAGGSDALELASICGSSFARAPAVMRSERPLVHQHQYCTFPSETAVGHRNSAPTLLAARRSPQSGDGERSADTSDAYWNCC